MTGFGLRERGSIYFSNSLPEAEKTFGALCPGGAELLNISLTNQAQMHSRAQPDGSQQRCSLRDHLQTQS
jgi:hypothetical protein